MCEERGSGWEEEEEEEEMREGCCEEEEEREGGIAITISGKGTLGNKLISSTFTPIKSEYLIILIIE